MLRKKMLELALRAVRSTRTQLAEVDHSLSQLSFWLKAHETLLAMEELNQRMRKHCTVDDSHGQEAVG
jgi:hypothetical protein